MTYADFQASEVYQGKQAGAALHVTIVDSEDPTNVLMGSVSQFQASDDFEALVVEEAGQDYPSEIAQGRVAGSGSCANFYSPEFMDRLPDSTDFVGRTFTVIESRSPVREPFEGTVLNSYHGVKINRVSHSFGARGLPTIDLAFIYEYRLKGKNHAERYGG